MTAGTNRSSALAAPVGDNHAHFTGITAGTGGSDTTTGKNASDPSIIGDNSGSGGGRADNLSRFGRC